MVKNNYEHRHEFAIDKSYSGYYSESIVCNGTSNDIIIIDNQNRRSRIEPDLTNMDGCVTIKLRSHKGIRREYKSGRWVELPIETKTITINSWEVESGYYYCEHSDLVVASPTVGKTLFHPKSRSHYISNITDYAGRMADSPDQITLQYFVNDPEGRYESIFGCMGSSMILFNCTKEQDNESGNVPTLTVVVTNKEKSYIHDRKDISSLFEDGFFIAELQTGIICLGITSHEAQKADQQFHESIANKNNEEINKRVVALHSEFEEKIRLHKEESELSISSLKNESIRYKNKVDKLSDENEVLKTRLSSEQLKSAEWQKLFDMQKEQNISLQKVREQRAKNNRADIAVEHEKVKYAHTVGKITAGFVFGVVLPVVVKRYGNK